MPKISVILTSFNHEKYICEAIESVLAQTFIDFELIIWDDASDDKSWHIINTYSDPRIRIFRNDEYRRAIHGVNKSIGKIASGEYIALHHSDDIWEKDKLEKQIEFLETHPMIGAVFTHALAIGEDSKPLKDPAHFYSNIFDQPNRTRHEWLNYFFYKGNALCHPSVLIRKHCYSDCGLYRYGFAQVGDLDMWIRLCLKYEIHVLPEKLVKFRVRDNEANTSGTRPDTRIRCSVELFQLFTHFLKLDTFKEFVAVFPQADRFRRDDGFVPGFVLAMISLEPDAPHEARAFATISLFNLIWNDETSLKIKKIYDFSYINLIEITGKYDVFSLEAITTLRTTIAQLKNLMTDPQQEGEEVTGRPLEEFLNWRSDETLPTHAPLTQQSEIEALRDEIDVAHAEINMMREELEALYRSTSWRITAPLRSTRRLITRLADRPRPLSLARATLKHGTECYQTKLLADPQVSRQRIVHVIGNFLTGGSSRLVVDLFERLGHLYEQEVVTQYNPDPPNYTGIPIHEFSGGDAWDKFINYLRLYRPDLVHVHYWEDPHWYGTMIKAAREFDCKIIQNVNTPTAPYMDSCISRYIYVSDYVKTRFGKRDQPSITIYPGSNFKLFSRDKSQPIPDDCIGMVYRLDIDKLHKKSIDVFIKVVQKRPQTKVIIVGGGPYLEPYKAAVKAGKVEHAFTFTGFVPYESLIGFYARMSLFVAPVWKESFGQVGPFAMSMGLPVVGYNVGALAELLGDCALLAPRGNSEALAELIISLLDDKERREQIGSRNRDRAHKLFSVENMVNDYLKLYQELIGNTQ